MINLSRHLKGTTTIGEMNNLPNRFVQVIYKDYVDFLKDPERQKMMAGEEIQDQLEEAMGG